MNANEKKAVAKSLAVALEVAGQEMSSEAMMMIVNELARYESDDVQMALLKCAKECRYKITLAEIIDRIDDQRPTADEAWQEVHHLSESDSKVMTEEQQQAFAAVCLDLENGDTSTKIACKKAFIDRYNRLVREARTVALPVKFVLSMGYDASGRLAAVQEAVGRGRLLKEQAIKMLPEFKQEILQLPNPEENEVSLLLKSTAAQLTAGKRL